MSALAPSAHRVTARAPARVDLERRVGRRRPNGDHRIATVCQAIAIHDDVTVEPSVDWEVGVTGPYAASVPRDGSNLALRAAHLLAETAAVRTPVRITIDKDIPVGVGLAGGSADAAGALVACDALWGLDLSRPELDELAAELGNDVPFALAGGTAIGSGDGEQLVPVLERGGFHWVLALTDGELAGHDVQAECDRLRGTRRIADPEPSEPLMAALASGDPQALGVALANDLQEAAISLRPSLRQLIDAGLGLGALGAIMTGSGPTVAFVVADSKAGLDLAVALAARGTAPEVKRATGPARGAHIVQSDLVRGW